MSEGLWPWEAHSVVFCEVRRLQELQIRTALIYWVVPLKEPWPSELGDPEFEAWSVWGLEVTNVSRIVALGSSMCCYLQRLEAPGRARFPGT